MTFDCIVMGGGPAGLSAALVLGRCRRSVAVIDAGRPRNPGHAAHGIFTRDGEDPHELRRIARRQLAPYDVRLFDDEVVAVRHDPSAALFHISSGDELEGLALRSGVSLDVDAIFVQFGSEQASPLAEQLGCTFDEKCKVCPKEGERGDVPGLFVAGDASHDLQLYTIAVAEGVKAACAMNAEIRKESER